MDPWESKVKKILGDNIESCKYYVLAHEKKAQRYRLIYNVINTFTTIVMFINFILSTLVSGNTIEHQNAIIAVAVLSALVGSNNIFNKYCFDPAKRMAQHVECKNKYKQLISSITIELNFGMKDRTLSEEFTKQICKEMLEIETDPNTPSIYSKKYLKEKRALQKTIINEAIESNVTSDIENNSIEQKDLSNKTISFEQIVRETGIKGLSEDENIDFDILYNNSILQFQRDRLNE